MLAPTMKDTTIWPSSANPITFGWEVAKANITDGEPDVGVRTQVNF